LDESPVEGITNTAQKVVPELDPVGKAVLIAVGCPDECKRGKEHLASILYWDRSLDSPFLG